MYKGVIFTSPILRALPLTRNCSRRLLHGHGVNTRILTEVTGRDLWRQRDEALKVGSCLRSFSTTKANFKEIKLERSPVRESSENTVKIDAFRSVKNSDTAENLTDASLKNSDTGENLTEGSLKNSEVTVKASTKSSGDANEVRKSSEATTSDLGSTESQAVLPSAFTVPNVLTMTRIMSAPLVGYFIVVNEPNSALAVFAYSCITDFVDGYVARRFNMKSVLGSILDPAADKLLMAVCTLSLTYTSAIPGAVAAIIIGRDAMLSAMAFYYRFKSLDAPRTRKFFNLVRYPTISVHPDMLGKANTALQMVYIGGLVCRPWVEQVAGVALGTQFETLGMVVAATTLASGLSYLVRRRFEYVGKTER